MAWRVRIFAEHMFVRAGSAMRIVIMQASPITLRLCVLGFCAAFWLAVFLAFFS
jgi:hypothetical protein